MVATTLVRAVLGAALAASSAVAQSDAWHFDIVKTLMVARMDPIVDPNRLSMHMHRIMGGSNFAAGYSYENNRASDCSTVYTPFDMSNYWTAQMYWVSNDANEVKDDTTYTSVPGGHRFYYFLTRNAPDVPVSPFPEGLRMLAGNKDAKNWAETGLPENAWSYTCQKSRTDMSQNIAVSSWNELDTYCPELKLDLKFPSCWDGKNLYSDDGSHMAYPSNMLYGVCPLSHPVRIPAIMFETTWLLHEVIKETDHPKNRIILSNGDTTGFGTHVDFANGWNTSILYQALNDPRCVNVGHSMPATDCPVLNINYESGRDAAEACKPMRGRLDEDGTQDGVAIKKLPGCNLPWASGPKPTCDDKPTNDPDLTPFLGVDIQGYVATAADTLKVYKANILSQTADEWQKVGCIGDFGFPDPTMWHSWDKMKVDSCQDFCGDIGMPYASLRLGYQCMCSSVLNNNATLVPDDKCNKACTGDSKVNCGGEGLMQTFYKPTVKAKAPSATDKSYVGCHVDGTVQGTRNPDWTDVDGCRTYCGNNKKKYFGVSNSRYCFCSNELKQDSWESRVPELECNAKCQLNEAQTCGGNSDGYMFQSVFLVDGEVEVPVSETTAPVPQVSSSGAAAAASTSFAAPTPVGAAKSGAANIVATSTAASSSSASAAITGGTMDGGKDSVSPTKAVIGNIALAQPIATKTCKRTRKRSQRKRQMLRHGQPIQL
ncbi:hypothetical protein FFLO_05554 [Filobasidium floriforme]|uniref:WSC domain-containing protein n=1 Tax=Filobasidium floriforme TaxID=5210 RepID=A0A8K0JH75_9TREE|nr:hypothetical protein FFLO_05554 [Filobasidium floriforme]